MKVKPIDRKEYSVSYYTYICGKCGSPVAVSEFDKNCEICGELIENCFEKKKSKRIKYERKKTT